MAVRMIAVDMDGTFLDENKQYNVQRFSRQYALLKQKAFALLSPVAINIISYSATFLTSKMKSPLSPKMARGCQRATQEIFVVSWPGKRAPRVGYTGKRAGYQHGRLWT